VLRALVRALTVERRRIVEREEHPEQVAVREDIRVEGELNDLSVTGRAAADLLIAGIRPFPAGISGHGLLDSPQLAKRRVEAPEASAAEGGELAHFFSSKSREQELIQ